MSIYTFTPQEIIAAIEEDENNLKFTIQEKKKNDNQSVKRFRLTLTGKSISGLKVIDAPLNITISNIVISKTLENPLDPQSMIASKNYKMSLEVKEKSNVVGNENKVLFEMQRKIQELYLKWVDQMKKEKKLSPKEKVHDVVIENYSDACPDEKLAGQQRENAVIRYSFPIDKKFVANHPIAAYRGKNMVIVRDFNKPKIDPKTQRIEYAIATVVDEDSGEEVPVNYHNAHQFVTRDSIIRRGRIDMTSGCQSSMGIALARPITTITVEQGVGGDMFDDDVIYPTEAFQRATQDENASQEDKNDSFLDEI